MSKLNLYILSPQTVIYQGQADALTSVNDKGVFDVLPQHAQFITLIKDRIEFWNEGKLQSVPVTDGVMMVAQDIIKVFLGLGGSNFAKASSDKAGKS